MSVNNVVLVKQWKIIWCVIKKMYEVSRSAVLLVGEKLVRSRE